MQQTIKAIGFDWSGVVYFHAAKFREEGARFLVISQSLFEAGYTPILYKHISKLREKLSRFGVSVDN